MANHFLKLVRICAIDQKIVKNLSNVAENKREHGQRSTRNY
jgi:hypothetical protein